MFCSMGKYSHIEVSVAVDIDNAEAMVSKLPNRYIRVCHLPSAVALVIVNDEVDGPRIEDLIELFAGCLGNGARHLRDDRVFQHGRHTSW